MTRYTQHEPRRERGQTKTRQADTSRHKPGSFVTSKQVSQSCPKHARPFPNLYKQTLYQNPSALFWYWRTKKHRPQQGKPRGTAQTSPPHPRTPIATHRFTPPRQERRSPMRDISTTIKNNTELAALTRNACCLRARNLTPSKTGTLAKKNVPTNLRPKKTNTTSQPAASGTAQERWRIYQQQEHSMVKYTQPFWHSHSFDAAVSGGAQLLEQQCRRQNDKIPSSHPVRWATGHSLSSPPQHHVVSRCEQPQDLKATRHAWHSMARHDEATTGRRPTRISRHFIYHRITI